MAREVQMVYRTVLEVQMVPQSQKIFLSWWGRGLFYSLPPGGVPGVLARGARELVFSEVPAAASSMRGSDELLP